MSEWEISYIVGVIYQRVFMAKSIGEEEEV